MTSIISYGNVRLNTPCTYKSIGLCIRTHVYCSFRLAYFWVIYILGLDPSSASLLGLNTNTTNVYENAYIISCLALIPYETASIGFLINHFGRRMNSHPYKTLPISYKDVGIFYKLSPRPPTTTIATITITTHSSPQVFL